MRRRNRRALARLMGPLLVAAALIGTPALAQNTAVGQETREGRESPEGGAYGAGADVHELESQGIVNWWSWDYGPTAKNPAHHGWPPPFGFALINFAIFLAVMWRLAWKPLKGFLLQRHDGIAHDLDEAAALRAEAEATLKQYQSKIAGIDREIETLLASIQREAEQEKARIMANAEADAKRLKLEAERQIAAEIDAARRELRRGVIEAAVAAADQTLRQNIGADDQRKMAERYVADVEHRAKAGRPS
jgi:F-type H+-transporting ATPase subunit b